MEIADDYCHGAPTFIWNTGGSAVIADKTTEGRDVTR